MRVRIVGVALLVCLVATGCVDAEYAEPELTFEQFEATVYQEPDTGIYIVNGDEAISEVAALREFYDRMVAAELDSHAHIDSRTQSQPLIVHQSGGQDAKWSGAEAINLTYCVSTSFGSDYGVMVAAMNDAAAAWEAVAPGVDFIHVDSKDSKCNARTGGVVFDVNPTNTTQYVARAFFPNDSRRARNVLFSTAYLVPGSLGVWTVSGVLKHELGHALGFRHEHTRPEAGTCYEDANWRALTAYDSSSVMHYPHCNGTQTGDLSITASDAAGAATLYPAYDGGGDPEPPAECGGRNAECSDSSTCCEGLSCNSRGRCR